MACIIVTIPGVRIILDRSPPPASSRMTLAPASAKRRATMHPALPAPTTT
jgi:hypothetical protein